MTETTKQNRKTVAAILDWLVEYSFCFEVSTYVLGAIALGLGILTVIASREESRRQQLVILGLRQGVIDSGRELEAEKLRNNEVLLSLLPRRIGADTSRIGWERPEDDKEQSRLKAYSDRTALIEFLPQVEPRRAAESLAAALKSAGWNVLGPQPNDELWKPFF